MSKQLNVIESLESRLLFTTFNPADSAALTTALNNAQLGDTITLQAGVTYTGGFVLKNKTSGSGWITIQSSNLGSLPGEGVRVGPANAGNMPKIISPGSNVPDIATQAGAHHFKFIGIEFIGYIANLANGSPQTHTTIMELGNDTQTSLGDLPHHIIVDRCYFRPDVYTRQVRSRRFTKAATPMRSSGGTAAGRTTSSTTTSKAPARISCSVGQHSGCRRPTSRLSSGATTW
jgi:hypothetical protein